MRMDGDRCLQCLKTESISISFTTWDGYLIIIPSRNNVCTFLEMNYKHSTKYGDILYISYSDSCGYITYT